MPHPDEDLLVDLALGSDDEVGAELSGHVAGCPDCRSTVAELQRVMTLTGHAEDSTTWSHPPARVWARIEEEIDAPATVSARESGGAPRAGRRVLPWAAGMAAAGLAIGLLSGRALWSEAPPAPAPAPIAQAQLDTLDTSKRLGEASVVRTGSGIDLQVATASPFDAGSGFIEVWLINKDGRRMVSVGVLRGRSPQTFPISQALIDQGYTIVDISREGFDDKPQHSGDSLARGTLSI